MSNGENAGGGASFGGLLFLVFLTLKLTGHIDWSWWWVFAPFWAPLVFAGLVFMIYLTYTLIRHY